MAAAVNVYGPQNIQVNTGTAAAYESLGYTEDGASFQSQAYYNPVPGDENGGTAGPPIDMQFMGEVLRSSLTLSKWDTAVWDKIAAYRNSSSYNDGDIDTASVGILMFQGSLAYGVKFIGTSRTYTFGQCVITGYEVGRGTKYSRLVLNFEAHKVLSTGVIYTEAANS